MTGPWRARGVVQLVVAAIGVGLQDAGEALKMPRGMLLPAIARGVIERGRRRPAAKRPVVAHIGPDVPCDGLALGQDRHRGVVAVQPLGGQHVALDQPIAAAEGPPRRRRPDRPASTGSDRCPPGRSARSAGSTADAGRTSRTGSSPRGWARRSRAASRGTAPAAG